MFIYWAAFIYSGHIYLCLFCLLMFAQTNTPWLSVTTPVCLHHTPNHTLQASLLSLNPHACAWLPKCTSAELRWHGWCAPGPVIVTSYSINCNVTVMMPDSVTVRSSIGESLDRHCCSNITPTWLAQKTTWLSWPQVRLQGQYSCRGFLLPLLPFMSSMILESFHIWRRHEPEAWAQCECERQQIQIRSIVSVLIQVRPHSFSIDMIAISFCNSCQFAKRNQTCSPLLMPLVSGPSTNPSPFPWWFGSPLTRLWLCHYSPPALHWITPLVARQV